MHLRCRFFPRRRPQRRWDVGAARPLPCEGSNFWAGRKDFKDCNDRPPSAGMWVVLTQQQHRWWAGACNTQTRKHEAPLIWSLEASSAIGIPGDSSVFLICDQI